MFILSLAAWCRLWIAYLDRDEEELPLAELVPLLQPAGPADKESGAQLEAEYRCSKTGWRCWEQSVEEFPFEGQYIYSHLTATCP